MKIDLDDYDIPKSAKFYKLQKGLSKELMKKCIKEISKEKLGNFLNYEYRKYIFTTNGNSAKISSACFKIKSKPTFIKGNKISEIKHGFIIFVEFEKYLAVLKKNCPDPSGYLKEYLDIFTSRELSSYINQSDNLCCEKLSVNGMSIGEYDILRKSYEAHDLMGTLPTFNSHRLIPRTAKFSENDNNYSISVNTSRITEHSEKGDIENIIDWCIDFKTRVESNTVSPFMEQFSSSIKLIDLPKNILPTAVLINISRLMENIGNNLELNFKSKPISNTRKNRLIKQGKKFFEVKGSVKNRYQLLGDFFELIKNSKTFSLRCAALSEYSVFDNNKNTSMTLMSFLNLKGCFDITFSDLSYFYTGKRLYRDSNMIQNVKYIAGIYEGVDSFQRALTEKGEKFITKKSVDFPVHSLFYRVQKYYKKSSNIIICDDLGSQEWADHFIFNKVKSGAPRVALVHSKAKPKESNGASEMQEVVGQAIKNLGKVYLSDSNIASKRKLWTKGYSPSIRTPKGQPKPPSIISNISRVRGEYDNFEHLKKNIVDIMSSPNCQREVVLAVNFVRKSKIEQLIHKAEAKKLTSHENQLLWLMSSFVSSCIEVGVRPKVLCRP
ncbi:hypothetical protein AMR76_06165 [Vibrio furnissii]|uniref:Uncharacterized protein n=1 Tax=Vibrio furnissii TaxID=29494 RepID=A0A0Q2V1N2_VIBFU|nr:hypothetical protein [Vibrio furnissii]KQH86672.1 hypothetical protein AMR76_06165 [Vibrio furnissii]